MGMPISLALRGRHADDAPRRGRVGRGDGRAARRRPGLQHLPRRLGRLPARPRRDRPRRLPARGRGGARPRRARPSASPAAPSTVPPAAGRSRGSTPAAWSRAGPSSGPRRRWPRCPDTDFCLSAGGDMVCRTARPGRARRGGSASRTRTTRGRLVAVVPVRTGAVATSGTAHRGAHLVDARTGARPTGVASVTVVGAVPDLGRHRRHRGVRPRPGRRPLAAHPRAHRAGGVGRRPHGARRRPQLTPDALDRAVSRFS